MQTKDSLRRVMKYACILYFPILLLYLELVFHLYMRLRMAYFPIIACFAVSLGMLVSALVNCFSKRTRHILTSVFSLFLAVLFCVEMICRRILQQYFQLFSALDTAAGNRLGDYRNAVVKALEQNWIGLLLMLVVPGMMCAIQVFRIDTFGIKIKTDTKKRWPLQKRLLFLYRFTAVPMIGCVVFYLLALAMVYLYPWEGDFTPEKLYAMDTNTDDQVEQLGLLTMLRLDCKHMIFGSNSNMDISLEQLADAENEKAVQDEEIAEEVAEPEIDTSPNVLELDLQKWIDEAPNEDVKWLSEYIQTVTPTRKNEYTGMFENYNVIFITAEGFSGYLIDETLTPTLYRLTHEGFVFNRFYSALHFTSTSGGEFQNLTGLYPKNGFPVSMKETGEQGTSLPFTLANILQPLDYTCIGFHFNENMYGRALSHPNLGYDWRQCSECQNLLTKETNEEGYVYWPQSDDYMVEQTLEEYLTQEPFHIYYLTLSGHLPYGFESNQMSQRNQEAVASLPYSEKTKSYIAANLELEKGLTRLVNALEEAEISDHTLIVMAPDHIPYSDIDVIEELAGRSFGTNSLESLNEKSVDFDVYKNSLIMWTAGMEEGVTVDKPCCQVDILPTILNLLGADYDSRLLAGRDILSDSEPLVVFFSSSWLTDKGTYNRFTGTFTPASGVAMTDEEMKAYTERIKAIAACRFQMTSIIIENDYYRLILGL